MNLNRHGRNPSAPTASAPSQALDAAITRALAHPPAVVVPATFAANVARHALGQPLPQTSRWIGWGPRLVIASGALLTAAMFALAPHTPASLTSLRFDAELLLFAELSGLALAFHRLLPNE